MSVMHAITVGVRRRGVNHERTFPTTAGKEIVIDEQLLYTGSTHSVALVIDKDKLQSFMMVADRALTVVANENRTFTLAAGIPVLFYFGIGIGPDTFLGDLDIDGLTVTNATGLTVRLRVWAVVDPT